MVCFAESHQSVTWVGSPGKLLNNSILKLWSFDQLSWDTWWTYYWFTVGLVDTTKTNSLPMCISWRRLNYWATKWNIYASIAEFLLLDLDFKPHIKSLEVRTLTQFSRITRRSERRERERVRNHINVINKRMNFKNRIRKSKTLIFRWNTYILATSN